MREYLSAWGEVLQLARELWNYILWPVLVPSALIVSGVLVVIAVAILLSYGYYWQASITAVGLVALVIMLAGHVAAIAIIKERKRPHA